MDQLTAFLTSIVALSMGVERVVEIIKGFSLRLRVDPDPRLDPKGKLAAHRRAYLQIIATLVGTVVACTIGPHAFISAIPDGDYVSRVRWISAVLLGLMASGGSAFWNHTLDIIGAIKDVKERVASGQQTPVVPRTAVSTGP